MDILSLSKEAIPRPPIILSLSLALSDVEGKDGGLHPIAALSLSLALSGVEGKGRDH